MTLPSTKTECHSHQSWIIVDVVSDDLAHLESSLIEQSSSVGLTKRLRLRTHEKWKIYFSSCISQYNFGMIINWFSRHWKQINSCHVVRLRINCRAKDFIWIWKKIFENAIQLTWNGYCTIFTSLEYFLYLNTCNNEKKNCNKQESKYVWPPLNKHISLNCAISMYRYVCVCDDDITTTTRSWLYIVDETNKFTVAMNWCKWWIKTWLLRRIMILKHRKIEEVWANALGSARSSVRSTKLWLGWEVSRI